jgi:hypothetical protein
MATRSTKPVEPVEESLDDDDYWTELVTENKVPPMKVKGIVLEQPTADVVDQWRAGGVEDEEKLLFGDKYDDIKSLFRGQPNYVRENFFKAYLKHMFGIEGDPLKG